MFYISALAHTNTIAAPSGSGSLQRCYKVHICIIVTTLMYKLIANNTMTYYHVCWLKYHMGACGVVQLAGCVG